MHGHRTNSARSCPGRAIDAPNPDDTTFDCACRGCRRVVGLGAPLSVLIRPSPRELPLLHSQLRAEVVKHDRRCAETGNREAAAWGGERGAWKAMLTELNADRGRPSELLWPTAYAHIVLFGALCEAAARVTPPRSTADVPSLTEALQTATGCLATWLAFAAVDTGGLPNPAL